MAHHFTHGELPLVFLLLLHISVDVVWVLQGILLRVLTCLFLGKLVQLTVESTQLERVLLGDLHLATPRATFDLFKRITESINSASGGVWFLVINLEGKTRRKVSKVVPEVVHDGSGDHLTSALQLIVEC